jgi:hypothetical protein
MIGGNDNSLARYAPRRSIHGNQERGLLNLAFIIGGEMRDLLVALQEPGQKVGILNGKMA